MDGLEIIDCDRRSLRLTRNGCGKMWESANSADGAKVNPWEGRAACVACAVGAANAGRSLSSIASQVEVLRPICVRCERQAERLIGGLHCVSCYNRDREAARGANAKGGRPRLCDQLHSVSISVANAEAVRVQRAERVTSRIEVMLTVAKRASGWVSFGVGEFFRPPPGYQLELGV